MVPYGTVPYGTGTTLIIAALFQNIGLILLFKDYINPYTVLYGTVPVWYRYGTVGCSPVRDADGVIPRIS